jgi:hypothetical protein
MIKYLLLSTVLLVFVSPPDVSAKENTTEFSFGLGFREFDSKVKKYVVSSDGAIELNLGLKGPIIANLLQWDLGIGVGAGGESNNYDGTSMFSFTEGRLGLATKMAFSGKLDGLLNGGVSYTYARLKSDLKTSSNKIDSADTGIGPYAGVGLMYSFNSVIGISVGLNYTYCVVDFDGVKANAGGPRFLVNAVFKF